MGENVQIYLGSFPGEGVLGAGLEPACLSAYAPQTYVSAIPPPELLNLECAENLPSIYACWQPGLILNRAHDRNRTEPHTRVRNCPEREINGSVVRFLKRRGA
jgi:hypothetical protein